MKQLPYDAVIFDLDGTLCNAEQGIISSARYAMAQLQQPIPEGVDLRDLVGPPLYQNFVEILGVPPDMAGQAMMLYRDYFEREGMYAYTVYPHIRSILHTLRANGAYLVMATSKPEKYALAVLDHFTLTHYFHRIVTEQDDMHALRKPELVRRALPAKYRRAAMVGDRSFDMVGAAANHIEGIGVEYGSGRPGELQEAGAAFTAPDTAALYELLCRGAEIPRGFFLTVEGPDGSGKTTQVDLLEQNLRDYGYSVLRTREPGGSAISEEIRRIILDTGNVEMCAACEALLYAAARAQHVHQVIRPAVEKGMLVLCDRFVDSSIAYQGGGRELGIEAVRQINAPAVGNMLPDATLYLNIDAKAALRRKRSASSPDRLELEDFDFHERVQRTYERLIRDNPQRYMIVNADQGAEALAREALAAVVTRLELPRKREA